MGRQWQRLVRVTVSGGGGSAVFDGSQSPEPGFAITFTTSKSLGNKQNTATVTIANLTKSRRNMLGKEYDKLKLEVGYRDTGLSLLFEGDIRDVKHEKSSPDVISTIECGDGDKAMSEGAVSKTFPAGTKPKEIIDHVRGEMPGIAAGRMVGIDDLPAYTRPVSIWGWGHRVLEDLGREHAFYWSIQNGKMNALKNDRHLGGNILISAETGMIGVPEITDKGVRVKCLLNSEIEPGKTVDVRSGFLDEGSGRDKRSTDGGGGIFRVASAEFSGASRDTEWFCTVEGNRVDGDKVVK